MSTTSTWSERSQLYLLRIEIDGHFHGGEPVKPWVARIDGTCERYGLRREFIARMNDWRDASKAWSGNVYGVVATFPLRDGNLYEVQRCRGNPSKRHVVREFVRIVSGKQVRVEPEQALALAERDASAAVVYRVRESGPEERPHVAHVTGLGTPAKLGFVLVDSDRLYRLHEGRLYEVRSPARRAGPFVVVESGKARDLSQAEAGQWLRAR